MTPRISISILSILLALPACVSATQIPTNYDRPDAGKVIIGLGIADPVAKYALMFRETGVVDPAVPRKGAFTFNTEELSSENPATYSYEKDQTGDTERGIVKVTSLPPGEYELYNVWIDLGEAQKGLLTEPFSVRFVVAPGQTTYLAHFQANTYRSRGRTNVFFVVSDQFSTDIELARKATPTLPATASNQSITALDFDNLLFIRPNRKQAYPR